MTARTAGLDQSHYAHSPFPQRRRWVLPGEARVAVTVFLYLERFEAEPPPDALFDRRYKTSMANHPPYNRAHSMFEYGNRVGIFRILELLDRHGLSSRPRRHRARCQHAGNGKQETERGTRGRRSKDDEASEPDRAQGTAHLGQHQPDQGKDKTYDCDKRQQTRVLIALPAVPVAHPSSRKASEHDPTSSCTLNEYNHR